MKNFVEVDIFLSTAQRNRHSLSEKRFPPFRSRVSVAACNMLDMCLLSIDAPVVEVSVIDLVLHRHPIVGVSVVNILVYCKLRETTDTRNLKVRNISFLAFPCIGFARAIIIKIGALQ